MRKVTYTASLTGFTHTFNGTNESASSVTTTENS